MALKGSGALAIYHDVPDHERSRFVAWHTDEHMPERVGVPGFLRARRYAALCGRPQYFILYETRDFAVLSSEDYLARLNDPTAQTREMAAKLALTIRAACRVSASVGASVGGTCATVRISADGTDALRARLVDVALPGIMRRHGIVGAHLLEADRESSNLPTAERTLRTGLEGSADWVLMVEGIDLASVSSFAEALGDPMLEVMVNEGMLTYYALQVLVDEEP